MKETLKYLYIFFCFIVPAIYFGIHDKYDICSALLIGVLVFNYLEKNPDFVDKYF